MKYKGVEVNPKKVSNLKFDGHCDECGDELGTEKWVDGENTGCTRICVVRATKREIDDELAEE